MNPVPINTESGPQVVLELLYSLKVRDAMSRDIITARADDSLRSIQYLMRDHNITGVPVMDGTRLIGLVAIGDIIAALDSGKIGEPARSAMSATIISLEDDMPLSFAVTYFDRYKYGRFPVLDKNGSLVGIITASDIVRSLLMALNEEVAKLEKTLASAGAAIGAGGAAGTAGASPAALPVDEMSFPVAPLDFSKAGEVSSRFKRALMAKGIEPAFIRRVAVASYELELNQVIHSVGGRLVMRVCPACVEVEAVDEGPGIADVEAAMREGFSTATEWVRSLGFGAGMGLPNVKRVSDRFSIESAPGKGTKVVARLTWEAPK